MSQLRSVNFEMLRPHRPELADLGALAERYAHPDPASALVKLRTFAEQATWHLYRHFQLPHPVADGFASLLEDAAFTRVVHASIVDKLHALRREGNKAAHGQAVQTQVALWLLEEAHRVACWLALRCRYVSQAEQLPPFKVPPLRPAAEAVAAHFQAQSKATQQRLQEQEKELQARLDELTSTRQQYEELKRRAGELEELAAQGQRDLSSLHFDEETTRRRLIDIALAQAGWRVGPNGTSTEEVSQEFEVAHQPLPGGRGRADYVLWGDDGQPLAVIEAKRTAKDPDAGRTQARLYADGLEKQFGQRPMVFTTNGYEIRVWDDAQNYPERTVYGFYAKDTLDYRVRFQRQSRQPLDALVPRGDITERLYQIEAIKHVTERFAAKRRKALIVQATGTGKTRVAVALTDLLMRAHWARRVLFLCDRKELRRQAKNVFGQFLKEPLTVVDSRTDANGPHRLFLATYPAMMSIHAGFDPGFFDLIIADESHRSVYNTYGELLRHFDCLQVGLTATPVDFIARNTFGLFDCQPGDPTAHYSYEDAVQEGFLVPYQVVTHTTEFLRRGIKYSQLSDAQRRQLEEQDTDADGIDVDAPHVDKLIYNRDTNRHILRNLMETGLRNATGDRIGKTILFARSHRHAELLKDVFDRDLYQEYGGKFCQIIDSHDDRAERLLDQFKNPASDLTLAISVDMLDTGVDVPEVVNLVFAKPVKSKVKFLQMIGRGTRLCANLFGPGRDKTRFLIFDHWGNFEYFDQQRPEAEPSSARSLRQQLFEARVTMAETALAAQKLDAFRASVALIHADLASLPMQTIAVRERWRSIESVRPPEVLEQFAASTVEILRREIAPLMQWVNIRGHEEAYELDLLAAQTQQALLAGDANRLQDCRADWHERLSRLPVNLAAVQEKWPTVQDVKGAGFWQAVTFSSLESARLELRGIMRHQHEIEPPRVAPKIIDVTEDAGKVERHARATGLREVDMAAYRVRVREALTTLFNADPTLQRIRRGEPVTAGDLQALTSLVLTQHPDVNLGLLEEFYPEMKGHLDHILRRILGMDAEAVGGHLAAFVQRWPSLTARQTQFLRLLQSHIAAYGPVTADKLLEEPFTAVHSDGLDGIFPDASQANDLLGVLAALDGDRRREASA